jgi:mRNA interferase MazF
MTTLHPGDVLTIRFPQKNPQGHEQEGYRPAIVVGLPSQAGTPRFDLVMVVPLTTDRGQPWAKISPDLYPHFPSETAGLRSDSIALLDQAVSIDTVRVHKRRGQLTAGQYSPIEAGLRAIFSLP